jgi:hypothetical protein
MWFLTGCLATLVAVGVFQLRVPAIASQALVKLQPFDPTSWLRGLGGWLTGNKDEVTAIAAGIGVVIAILALLVNARAQGVAARTGTWNSNRDVLWKYHDSWAQLYESRKKADQILKTMPPYAYNVDLTAALNQFEGMAFFGNRGHLDDEMAWTNYFDEAADLWNRGIGYIKWRREDGNDWTLYCEYEKWIHKLAKMDASRRKVANRKREDPSSVATAEDANIPLAKIASEKEGIQRQMLSDRLPETPPLTPAAAIAAALARRL